MRGSFAKDVEEGGLSGAISNLDVKALVRSKVTAYIVRLYKSQVTTWISNELVQIELKNLIMALRPNESQADEDWAWIIKVFYLDVGRSRDLVKANRNTYTPSIAIQMSDLTTLSAVWLGDSIQGWVLPHSDDVRGAVNRLKDKSNRCDEVVRAMRNSFGGKRLISGGDTFCERTKGDDTADALWERALATLVEFVFDGVKGAAERNTFAHLQAMMDTVSLAVHKAFEAFSKWSKQRIAERAGDIKVLSFYVSARVPCYIQALQCSMSSGVYLQQSVDKFKTED